MKNSPFAFVLLVLLAVPGCGRLRSGVTGTWKYASGQSTINLSFNDDGSVTWDRNDSGGVLLPTWLFYGKWKTAEGKLVVYGKFQGQDESREWTYSLEDGGSTLRLVDSEGRATTMTRGSGSP